MPFSCQVLDRTNKVISQSEIPEFAGLDIDLLTRCVSQWHKLHD
jgi:hypothetical protein